MIRSTQFSYHGYHYQYDTARHRVILTDRRNEKTTQEPNNLGS